MHGGNRDPSALVLVAGKPGEPSRQGFVEFVITGIRKGF